MAGQKQKKVGRFLHTHNFPICADTSTDNIRLRFNLPNITLAEGSLAICSQHISDIGAGITLCNLGTFACCLVQIRWMFR